MQSTTITDALRRVPLLAQLSDEQFGSVERGSEVWLRPSEVLVREGNPPLAFFAQLEGQTEWTRRLGQEPGIPEEIQPRIFEPLCLDIAQRIVVERHGGDIRVDSKPYETAFVVRLPVNVPGDGRVTS